MNINLRAQSGFTLIELVITISIVMMMIVGATASYGNFNNINTLKQAALTLKNNLRFAQANASSGNKPTVGCTKLSSYQVSFTGSSYRIQPYCDPEGAVGPNITTVTLPRGITIPSPPSAILFYILSKGTNIPGTTSIVLSGITGTYQIDVTQSGNVIDRGYSP
jgi:prepilin-type N-terminal cleavage/methylation domain-containing protein